MIIYAGNAAFWSANLAWESSEGKEFNVKAETKLLGGESFVF
jgi:hypothetical protein